MAKMRGTVTLFFVVLLDYLQGAELHLIEGVVTDSNTEFVSRPKNLDEDLPKIFDKILQQVLPEVPHDPVYNDKTTADRLTTKNSMDKSYSLQKHLEFTEFELSSKNPGKHLAKVFDEMLLQEFSKVPRDSEYGETVGTAAKLTTKSSKNKRTSVAENSLEPDILYGNMYTAVNDEYINPTNDQNYISSHKRNNLSTFQRTVEQKKVKQSSLFNRDLDSEELTTPESEYPAEPQRENPPCTETLHFLQKNIAIAGVIVAAILVVTVSLVLLLIFWTKRKQSIVPPASMTYNIFIMTGKTWWQKTHENKDPKKHMGKEKQLEGKSYV